MRLLHHARARRPATVGRAAAAPTEDDVRRALDDVARELGEVNAPALVTSRVVRVARVVATTLPGLRGVGLDSPQARPVVATATSYLPGVVAAYLGLAGSESASLRHVVDDLDVLGSTIERVCDALNRADLSALEGLGRQLEERFSASSR